MTRLPRLRQAVLAANDLDQVAAELRAELALGEPYADPGVEYFGLRNAVFALGDTFLEVVSPVRADTAAGRQLERRGGDCGYMVMFQVDELGAARRRAGALGVREVFEVSFQDIAEVHLHPADMSGAIVSLSDPRPPRSWRWGGPGWADRSAPLALTGATIAVEDPAAVRERWRSVVGELPGITFTRAGSAAGSATRPGAGLVQVLIKDSSGKREPIEIGGVRFRFISEEEER